MKIVLLALSLVVVSGKTVKVSKDQLRTGVGYAACATNEYCSKLPSSSFCRKSGACKPDEVEMEEEESVDLSQCSPNANCRDLPSNGPCRSSGACVPDQALIEDGFAALQDKHEHQQTLLGCSGRCADMDQDSYCFKNGACEPSASMLEDFSTQKICRTPLTTGVSPQCPKGMQATPGYQTMLNNGGRYNWWACGSNCTPKYWTDGVCNCACEDCVEQPICRLPLTTGTAPQCPTGMQATPGYQTMLNNGGRYNWWACGSSCTPKYWTDGVCNCACQSCAAPNCDGGAAPKCPQGYAPTAAYQKMLDNGGRYNWWACGSACTPKYWTDGVCNCACNKC